MVANIPIGAAAMMNAGSHPMARRRGETICLPITRWSDDISTISTKRGGAGTPLITAAQKEHGDDAESEGEFGHDGVDSDGPHERLGSSFQSARNSSCGQTLDAREGTAPNEFVGPLGKPAFDEIQPTATGRHVVHSKARMPL